LGRLGVEGLDSLVVALEQDSVVKNQIAAANGIAQIGSAAEPAVDALSTKLAAGDPQLGWHVAFALGQIGKPAVAALSRLVRRSRSDAVRRLAIKALGWIGPDAESEIPSLVEISASENCEVQMEALTARAKIDEEGSEEELRTFVEMTKQEETRLQAIARIGELGERGLEGKDALRVCFQRGDSEVRREAAMALARVRANDPETIEELRGGLDVADEPLCTAVIAALASFAADSSDAVPDLKEIQATTHPSLAAAARVAIETIEAKSVDGS
jgi:HEAT repeat protein